jgi:hypothetical protein
MVNDSVTIKEESKRLPSLILVKMIAASLAFQCCSDVIKSRTEILFSV